MSTDFFGGILDDLRHVGDSVNGFFDSSLGGAISGAAREYVSGQEDDFEGIRPSIRENFVAVGSNIFKPRDEGRSLESENFYSTERQWIERLRRFANVVDETQVKL